jgi:uncharacterized protein YbaR (Trm112 family)
VSASDRATSNGLRGRGTHDTSSLAPELLSILACPEDKGPLYYIEDLDVLFNPRLQRVYRVREGIPVMLIDEAQTLETSEGERLMARVEAEGIAPTFTVVDRPDPDEENL